MTHAFHTETVLNALRFISILLLTASVELVLGRVTASAEPERDLNDTHSVVDNSDHESTPLYESAPSRWAVGFKMAQDRFPTRSAIGQVFQMYGEWVLPFQRLGLFTLGGHFGSFPLRAPGTTAPYAIYENMIGGLQFGYQFKMSKYPIVVPTLGTTLEYYRIRRDGTQIVYAGGINFGLSAGLMLNLGFLDAVTSRDAYQSINLTKAYLTAEVQTVNVSNPFLTFSGNFYFFGVRMEFE